MMTAQPCQRLTIARASVAAMSRKTALWALAALLGIALAAGITWATSQLTSQHIGLASEPLSAGSRLAPPAAGAPDARHVRRTGPQQRAATTTTLHDDPGDATPRRSASTSRRRRTAPAPAVTTRRPRTRPRAARRARRRSDDGQRVAAAALPPAPRRDD